MKKEKFFNVLSELMKQYRIKKTNVDFNNLYTLGYRYIRELAFSIVEDYLTSEDIAQDVFEKILKINKNKIPDENIIDWLYVITKNTAIDYIRKERKIKKVKLTDEFESSNSVEEILDLEVYKVTIAKLTIIERNMVYLKVIVGLTFKEIAYLLKMSISKVEYAYYNALKKLKSKYDF